MAELVGPKDEKGGWVRGNDGRAFRAWSWNINRAGGGWGERAYRSATYHARTLLRIGGEGTKEIHLMAAHSTSCAHYSEHSM